MQKKSYNTAGRAALIDFLSSHPDEQFTAEQLCKAIYGDENSRKSSIYRQLTQLCNTHSVQKFRSESSPCDVFQYVGEGCDCDEHFHEKCIRCGKVEHLDCHASAEFFQHLLKEHGFEVLCGRSVLYGLCANCRAGGESHV